MGKKIAIYGAGTIGACQATLTSGNGYSTVVIGHSEEGLSRCRNTMLQNWNNLIAQKLATAANRRAAMDLVTITNDVSALRDCDIVFEAVSEDVNIKQRVYSIITEVCGRDIIQQKGPYRDGGFFMLRPLGIPNKLNRQPECPNHIALAAAVLSIDRGSGKKMDWMVCGLSSRSILDQTLSKCPQASCFHRKDRLVSERPVV